MIQMKQEFKKLKRTLARWKVKWFFLVTFPVFLLMVWWRVVKEIFKTKMDKITARCDGFGYPGRRRDAV